MTFVYEAPRGLTEQSEEATYEGADAYPFVERHFGRIASDWATFRQQVDELHRKVRRGCCDLR